jgi:hypothetical protein
VHDAFLQNLECVTAVTVEIFRCGGAAVEPRTDAAHTSPQWMTLYFSQIVLL